MKELLGNLLWFQNPVHIYVGNVYTDATLENIMSICALLPGTTCISRILNISSGINTSLEASNDVRDAFLARIRKATNTMNIAFFNLKLSNCPIKKY